MKNIQDACKTGWFLIVICFLVSASPVYPAQIEGVSFEDRIRIQTTPLVLHNVGLMRWQVVLKAYVAALYLGENVSPKDALTDVPKRLELHYFWPISGKDFGPAGEKVLSKNISDTVCKRLRRQLDRINALYEDVKPGDRYSLTYLPGIGTELALNGKPMGVIDGADFAAAYFSIWLGQKPMSASLKAQLLGQGKKTKSAG